VDKLLAFHSDPKIKEKYLNRLKEHHAADEIIKGQYWNKGKGCAVGCTIHSGKHKNYETELGIPKILARLEDVIFENLPNKNAQVWPIDFLSAIEPGSDLSMVWPKFALWLLIDPEFGVVKFAKTERTRELINKGTAIYKEKINGENIGISRWTAADADADAAYAYAAAYAAAYAYAASASDADAAYSAAAAASAAASASAADADAAYSAAAAAAAATAVATVAAASASDAAAYANAYADAYAAARIAQSKKLIELLKEAPIG